MKKTISFKLVPIFTLLAVVLMGGLPLQNASAQGQPAPAPPGTDTTSIVPDNPTIPSALPSDIDPNSPLAQVIRLVQAGVEQSVVLAYIGNSSSAFNLDSDQIIYLNDIGAPKEIVTAMMQRDQQLKQMNVTAGTQTMQPAPTTEVATEQPVVVTQNYFYDTLSPYGEWVNVEDYGMCWRPTVVVYNGDWQPYCDHGHWVYTNSGWYWASDYSWGGTTFHYGRWFHHPRHGWCWWPDTTWGPSWVTWRYSDDYCGWAPLPPRTIYQSGIGIVFQGRNVSVGFDFGLNAGAFTFVRTRDFCDPHPRHRRIGSGEVGRFYGHTTVINNFDARDHNFVNRGIDPERITAVTRTPIHQVEIHETTARVPRGEQFTRDNRTLNINRPNFVGAPVESLHQGIVPHPLHNTPNPPRNNFQQQPVNQNPHPAPGVSVPQTRSPEIPRGPVNGPQNHNTTPLPVVPPVHNPQVGTPVQTPPPNNYNNDNRRLTPPRTQDQQTPRGMTRNPSEQGNTSTQEHSIGSPAVNHSPPPVVPAVHPQNNYDTPRNGASYNAPRSTPSQASAPAAQSHGAVTYSPPVEPAAHPQNNYNAPRNQPYYNAPRSNPSQASAPAIQSHGTSTPSSSPASLPQGSNKQGQVQDKRGH